MLSPPNLGRFAISVYVIAMLALFGAINMVWGIYVLATLNDIRVSRRIKALAEEEVA